MDAQMDVFLVGYWPSECRAVLEHKYFLGIERGYDPPLAEVIESWEQSHARRWRTEKMRRDAKAQLLEIESYRQELSREDGRHVAFAEAARKWIVTREAEWREEWETYAVAMA